MSMKETDFRKMPDGKVLWKLMGVFARHNRSTLVSSLCLSLLEGIRPYVSIILLGILIDELNAGAGFKRVMSFLAAGLSIAFLMQLVVAYLRDYMNARIENCMERQNRDMNRKSMEIDYEYLENPYIQEKKRKQEQVVNVRGGIYWMLIWPLDRGLTGLVSVMTAIVVAVPMFLAGGQTDQYGFIGSHWLSVILLAVMAVSVYGGYHSNRLNNRKIRDCFEEYNKCSKVSNYFLHNILSGSETAKDLRIFGQEKLVEEGVAGRDGEAVGILRRMRALWMKQNSLERTLSSICGGSAYLYAGLRAYMGLISIGSVVRYAASIIKCVDGFSEVLFALSQLRETVDYGRDFLEYMEYKSDRESGTISVDNSNDGRFLLEFDHVSFRYPGSSEDVIKDLCLKLDIGERMAIVGRNGSGKTTFIKLLCRLYDATEGCIRLNGRDIREYDDMEYRNLFSVVFQDYRIFSLKVGENIAASEEMDEGKVMDALQKAGLGERLAAMGEGLDTYIGKDFSEKGVNVSGGERQKMAIARAIYKGAPFVIMDEPTAALDPVSECEVYAGFDKMVGRKTAIYISHRLASCRFCSDILVFDAGRVVQRGKHEKLVEEEGLYRKLWNAQAQYYEG